MGGWVGMDVGWGILVVVGGGRRVENKGHTKTKQKTKTKKDLYDLYRIRISSV